jgi:lantibiotic biosynthesis protein
MSTTSDHPREGQRRSPWWRPILEGAALEDARLVIGQIAERLTATSLQPDDFSLANGRTGIALLFAYLAVSGPSLGIPPEVCDGWRARAEDLLSAAIAALGEQTWGPGLYFGFAGVAWAAQHITELWPAEAEADGDDDLNAEIDQAVLEVLEASGASHDYTLASGLVGLGVYARERWPRPAARRCVELIVDRLGALAQPGPQGLCFPTPSDALFMRSRSQFPDGASDLGMSHGMAGILAFLANARPGLAPPHAETARAIMQGSAPWMIAQQHAPPHHYSRFPGYAAPPRPPQPASFGWCSGDPGVILSLVAAARSVGDARTEAEVLGLARSAARVPGDQTLDPGLCHGAAGVGHIFNRLYQATRDEVFLGAARAWFGQALDFRRSRTDEGVVGYVAWTQDNNGPGVWTSEEGFLRGAAGVALALLGAATPIEPAWDRIAVTSLEVAR